MAPACRTILLAARESRRWYRAFTFSTVRSSGSDVESLVASVGGGSVVKTPGNIYVSRVVVL
jgi:hypothetical protein